MTEDAFITFPKGFIATGVHVGLKKTDAPDFACIASKSPCRVAGVYTTNLVKGHSLKRSIDLVNSETTFHAVLINSGNANACIGRQGIEDANRIAKTFSSEFGCNESEVLTFSTGVIGQRMPIDLITAAMPNVVKNISETAESAHLAMHAIMTTDTVEKEAAAQIECHEGVVRIAGIAKGSGMIHPNMATMISVITTDVDMDDSLLSSLLKRITRTTYNRVSVDGDTSVCDSVIIMANGQSGVHIEEHSEAFALFESALYDICEDLACKIAADGEGATKLIEVNVVGAPTEKDAYLCVLSVCRSPLVKTAIYGEDANCGRIMTAIGYSGAQFDPEKVDIYLGSLPVYKDGCALSFDESVAKDILSQKEIGIEIHLNAGDFNDRMWTCDFTHDYVTINGSYRS